MTTTGIRIAGFGGQGVILAGMIIGRAAAIHDDKHVTLTQSFGPEARGSACSVQFIVSSERILYPYLTQADVLVAMSQEACTRFAADLKPRGLLLFEQNLIRSENIPSGLKAFGIPATRLAEELGRRLVLNLVMVGFAAAMTGIAEPASLRKAIPESVPAGTESLNLAAFEKGLEYGLAQLR